VAFCATVRDAPATASAPQSLLVTAFSKALATSQYLLRFGGIRHAAFWLTPWRRIDEHLPLSHIAEVTHVRGFFWDAISVESSGGLNPLRVFGLPKPAARYFVDHVRARLDEAGPASTAQPPRR
jgi:hypothetical protein